MTRKLGLLAITLLGLSTIGGCETMYGRSSCPGGCCGGSCGTGASSAASPSSYAPSSPSPAYGGGSGTK